MSEVTTYTLRRLGRLLKSGAAHIEGTACDPWGSWDNARWIVQVPEEQRTYHVYVCHRPRWARYVVAS